MSVMTVDLESRAQRIGVHIHLQDGLTAGEATTEFDFQWSDQDQEDLRWYLEDYLTYPVEPATGIATRIEARIAKVGDDIFAGIFRGTTDAAKLWEQAVGQLGDLRVELRTAEPRLAALPWELIRDPDSQALLALSCASFVRVHARPSRQSQPPPMETRVRILLVICRPAGAADVPFRSVASRLLKGLDSGFERHFELNVLRPPTYSQLDIVLRQAARSNRPYRIVHFDGHGLQGGLIFESSTNPENTEMIAGARIGRLLADVGAPLLILNACRSAFSDPPPQPVRTGNTHQEVREFGSLAQVVADQGLPFVLAMRFNVFVDTAARFMLTFYSNLVAGATAGEASNAARAQLAAEPVRRAIPRDVELQDWIVPVAFESEPVRLFPIQQSPPAFQFDPSKGRITGADDLPHRPDVGFFGRDETLLALDRAFDSENVVVLHAYAGAGKTATAVEFGRWYLQTGGTLVPPLFTTFDTKRTTDQVVDQLGRHFAAELAEAGKQWAAIQDAVERRRTALEVLSQRAVLWIWDNVEPIGGFPAGTESAWTQQEAAELADFLRDASRRGTKFLLTSRRDESEWLGLLPARITMPPMPMLERVQLTEALARKINRQSGEVQDWRPLLDFTQGNPLAITVLVTHALRKRIRTTEQILEFVSDLRSGQAAIVDDPAQGRTRSLTASLNYGFEHAFPEEQRKALSLLHLFQGYVNRQIFEVLGQGLTPLPEVASLGERQIQQMFEVAGELGILEPFGTVVYRIHPAVPWFFKAAFETYFGSREQECQRHFCMVTALAAVSLSKQFVGSAQAAANALSLEEANLRYALDLSIQLEEWLSMQGVLHALEDLYVGILHNTPQWKKVVASIAKLVTDTGGRAIPGRETAWAALTEYQMRLADSAGHDVEAEHLARTLVDYHRGLAVPYLEDDTRLTEGYEEIHNLAVMLQAVGKFIRKQGSSECVDFFRQGYELSQRIGDDSQMARCAQELTYAYYGIDSIKDMDEALKWLENGMEVVPDSDSALQGKLKQAYGDVYYLKLEAALARKDGPAAGKFAELTLNGYIRALELLPDYAYEDRATVLLNLGAVYIKGLQFSEGEKLCREALQLARETGSVEIEIRALLNIASALAEQLRFDDAIAFAKAALAAASGFQEGKFNIAVLEMLASIQARKRDGN
jgi:tetratricopeptide (TPR) repeat protein